jgi:hypothetical protein
VTISLKLATIERKRNDRKLRQKGVEIEGELLLD